MPGKETEATTIPQLRRVFRMTKANLDLLVDLRDGALGFATDETILYRQNGDGAANWEAMTSLSPTTTVRKTADQIVNNSVVLVNDTHLLLPVAANEVWEFRVLFIGIATGAADFKLTFVAPVGATGGWWRGTNVVATEYINAVAAFAATGTKDGFAGNQYYELYGLIINGANAGNLQLQWAQNAAEVSDTTIFENSVLIAHQIA